MKKIVIASLVFFVVNSCQKDLTPKEYCSYLLNPKNGFAQKNLIKSSDGNILNYLPTELMVINSQKKYEISKVNYSKIKDDYSGNIYFNYKHVLNSIDSNRVNIHEDMVKLINTNNEKVVKASFVMEESVMNSGPYQSFMILFPIPEEQLNSDFAIVIEREGVNEKYQFSKSVLKNNRPNPIFK